VFNNAQVVITKVIPIEHVINVKQKIVATVHSSQLAGLVTQATTNQKHHPASPHAPRDSTLPKTS